MATRAPDLHSSTDAYAARFRGSAGEFLLGVQARAIGELLDRLGGGPRTALDVGGGHAQVAPILAARGLRVTVLGSDPVCARRLRSYPGVRFVTGELADPPFADRSFGLVTCFRILPHVPQWERLLAGLCRLAERAILVDVPVARGFNALSGPLFALKRAAEGNTRPYASFRLDAIASAFAAHGFAVDAAYPQFALPMVLHRVLHAPRVSRALEAAARWSGATARFGSPVVLLATRAPAPVAAARPAPREAPRGAPLAVVTGANGFTGSHLCLALRRRGYAVRGLVRPHVDGAALEAAGVELVRGELTRAADVRDAVRGADVVFHVAAAYRVAGKPASYYRLVNVEGTRNVIEAVAAHGVARLVHCSTVGVHGHVREPPCREDSPFAPGDPYQRSKLEGELLVRAAAARGLPATIVRPAGIYGPGDTRFLKLYRAIQRGVFRMVGSGRTLFHPVYIDDLVAGMILAAESPAAAGRTYILAGPDQVTLDELARIVAAALRVTYRSRRVPLTPVLAAAYLCEWVCRPLGVDPPLHPRRVHFFTHDRAFDISRARRELGYDPAVDTRTGIALTIRHHVEAGDLRPLPGLAGAPAMAR